MKSEVEQAIKDLGGAPYLWQIEEATNMKCNSLRAHLKGYPEELNISLTEKKILEHYEIGISFKELAEKTQLLQNTVRNIVIKLNKRGLLKYGGVKYQTSDGKNIYVKVVSDKTFKVKIFGAKKATEVELKGCGGYIIPECGKKTACIIFKDTVPYRVRVEMSDIKIVEKHKFKGKL